MAGSVSARALSPALFAEQKRVSSAELCGQQRAKGTVLQRGQELTYLALPLVRCAIVEKLCHQTLQSPERGLFRCLGTTRRAKS